MKDVVFQNLRDYRFFVRTIALFHIFILAVHQSYQVTNCFSIHAHRSYVCIINTDYGGSVEPDAVLVVQAQEVNTEFFCQLSSDVATSDSETLVDWQINGTYLRNLDTRNGLIRLEGHNGANEVLVITAVPQYNNTVVACIVFHLWSNGSVTIDPELPQATLIIQGTLLKLH